MEQSPAPRHFTRALCRRRSELFAVFGDLEELRALSTEVSANVAEPVKAQVTPAKNP